MGEQDERTPAGLYAALLTADWDISETAYSSYGATVTFQKQFTHDAPGGETRKVQGTDEDDALRKFLAELAEQEAS